jgi:hypothetical protein
MRGAICAIFIVILSKNYNSNALSQTWFRGKTPSSPYLFFGAFHAIWRRTGQIAVAADDETGLYFGIAPRRHSAVKRTSRGHAAMSANAKWRRIVAFLRTNCLGRDECSILNTQLAKLTLNEDGTSRVGCAELNQQSIGDFYE